MPADSLYGFVFNLLAFTGFVVWGLAIYVGYKMWRGDIIFHSYPGDSDAD